LKKISSNTLILQQQQQQKTKMSSLANEKLSSVKKTHTVKKSDAKTMIGNNRTTICIRCVTNGNLHLLSSDDFTPMLVSARNNML